MIVTGPVKSISPAHICICIPMKSGSYPQQHLSRDELTPLVLIQQIVVVVHCVVLAGPQTMDFPEPLQQYGDPELQTLLAMGPWVGQFELE